MAAAIPSIDPALTAPSTTASSADPLGSSALGENDFLKLLLAQLANQDPTAPTDNQAFVAQLAQFSQLQAQQGTNTRLDSMLAGQASATQTSAVDVIGKQVNYRTDMLTLQAGLTASTQAILAAPAANVTVSVVDATGNTVRTIAMGAQPAGVLTVPWDGNDNTGNREPPGTYNIVATALDASGKSVAVGLTGTGQATGVSFTNGVSQLEVNGSLLPMTQVTSINERTTTP